MADLPINVVDIGVGGMLLISAILAFSRGFVHEILSVAGWIGAIFATIHGFPYLQPHARAYISMDIAADLTAGVIIFVLSLAALSILTRSISSRVKDSALSAIDRSLGFLFGLARGAVLVCLFFIVANMMMPLDGRSSGGDKEAPNDAENDALPAWVQTSRSLPLIKQGADMLATLVPQGKTKKAVKDTEGAVENKAMEMLKKMTLPNPKSPTLQSPEEFGAYDSKSRQGMDKAFESAQ